MTEAPSSDWSDAELVDYIRHWAIERSKCGLDVETYNWIIAEHLSPAEKILEGRGPGSVAKALPLLTDDNPEVRLVAAGFAYQIDPPRCLDVLMDLMKTPSLIGIAAYMALWVTDRAATPDLVALWHDQMPGLLPPKR